MKNKKKQHKDTPGTETRVSRPVRRRFLSRLWTGLGLFALAEFIAVGFLFLRRRNTDAAEENADLVRVGPVDRFERGTVTAFVRDRFYLSRLDDGGFLALSRQCTHLGCTVPWVEDEKRFICPCHASACDIAGGVIHSPAQRALDVYPLTIENNIISVDPRQSVRRYAFLVDQVKYPDKK